jgi:hypothetical protein
LAARNGPAPHSRIRRRIAAVWPRPGGSDPAADTETTRRAVCSCQSSPHRRGVGGGVYSLSKTVLSMNKRAGRSGFVGLTIRVPCSGDGGDCEVAMLQAQGVCLFVCPSVRGVSAAWERFPRTPIYIHSFRLSVNILFLCRFSTLLGSLAAISRRQEGRSGGL